MRFPFLVGVVLAGALACATGQEIDGKIQRLADAGPLIPPVDETGGAGGSEPISMGGMIAAGGSMPVGMGGMKPAAGGSGSGGKGTGGSGAGGKATGGMAGAAAGGTGAGGKPASGGAMSSGGADPGDGGGNCQAGQKFCGGLCTPPAPRVGCSATGCDPCTLMAPANGYITCANNQCVFDCLSGYTKNGNNCEGAGTGGMGGSCKPTSCPACNVISGPACCTQAGKCGCPLVPWVAPTCV